MTSINYILGAIIYFNLLIISFELIEENNANDNDNDKNLLINEKKSQIFKSYARRQI
jgi:hypothetical protein